MVPSSPKVKVNDLLIKPYPVNKPEREFFKSSVSPTDTSSPSKDKVDFSKFRKG